MVEIFLILLAGGVMLAAAISDPKQVTLLWLRLAGLIGLAMGALAIFFFAIHPQPRATMVLSGLVVTVVCVLGQLGFVQMARVNAQRICAWLGFAAAVVSATLMLSAGSSGSMVATIASCVGVASMCGLALMDMLLGHAYLTASKMTMAPFSRLNNGLAIALLVRAIVAVGGVFFLQNLHPVNMLWGMYGLFAGTRWLIGLIVPAVFIYMARDCINRRATQSATGILYVAGVLVFIGEIMAVYLVRMTALPF